MKKEATIIAVVNQKGGTAKTTTVENLGMQEIQRAKYDIDLFLKSDEEQKKERVRKHNIT